LLFYRNYITRCPTIACPFPRTLSRLLPLGMRFLTWRFDIRIPGLPTKSPNILWNVLYWWVPPSRLIVVRNTVIDHHAILSYCFVEQRISYWTKKKPRFHRVGHRRTPGWPGVGARTPSVRNSGWSHDFELLYMKPTSFVNIHYCSTCWSRTLGIFCRRMSIALRPIRLSRHGRRVRSLFVNHCDSRHYVRIYRITHVRTVWLKRVLGTEKQRYPVSRFFQKYN